MGSIKLALQVDVNLPKTAPLRAIRRNDVEEPQLNVANARYVEFCAIELAYPDPEREIIARFDKGGNGLA